MRYVLKNARVFTQNRFQRLDIAVCNGVIVDISPAVLLDSSDVVFDFNNCIVLPGLTDVHVHLREPGFSYKEDILSGTLAAAHGGFTSVCSMPNLYPAPDSKETLDAELEAIHEGAKIHVHPYGTITKGRQGKELSDMESMADSVVAFTDDGSGIQTDELMLSAMRKARSLGKIIAAHCEDNSLLNGGYIHNGEYARLHEHRGISSESEYKQIERDLRLVEKTGCDYHVCHISTAQSVELIRMAKRNGLPVTCETAPHYLVFNDMQLEENGRFKMNPPIRSEADRQSLLEGICDGTIDMIATDHAPHSIEEKGRGLRDSLMGVVGLETSFAAVYTYLVKPGIITMTQQLELMQNNAKKRFGIGGEIAVGADADLAVFSTDESYVIDSSQFLSKGKSSPFDGRQVYGKCKLTLLKGGIVWQER